MRTRAQMLSDLHRWHTMLTLPPVALGLTRTSLVDKTSAFLYSCFLDVGLPGMPAFLNNFVSLTTDMGTESGIADIEALTWENLMPPWLLRSQFETGCDDDVDGIAETSPFIFRKVLCISGCLHIISNACKQVYQSLRCWESFYADLKHLEKLVSNPHKLRHYKECCVRPSCHHEKDFEKRAPHLYSKRWGEVWKFCCWLSTRLDAMRDTFDTSCFQVQERPSNSTATPAAWEDDIGDGFSPQQIQRALSSWQFHANVDLVMLLDSVPQQLSAWCEQCTFFFFFSLR